MKKVEKKVHDAVLDIAKEMAKKREGALFVIGPKNKFKKLYEPLFPQSRIKHKVYYKGMDEFLTKLATLDGAVIISNRGNILAYGSRLKRSRAVKGFGTKHAAAAGITGAIPGSTAILVSEEVNWIKVFKDGKIVLEMDPVAETSRSLNNKIISFLTDNDTALLTAAGASAALIGFSPVLVIGGTYLAVKTATGIISKSLSKLK